MHPLNRRRDAAEAAVRRFSGVAFKWGECDCAAVARTVAVALGWPVALMPSPRYRTDRTARAALAKFGAAGLEDMLDRLGAPRIAPAAALPGDLIALPGEGGWLGLTVALGNGRVLGFQGGVCGVMQPTPEGLFQALAWRLEPKGLG